MRNKIVSKWLGLGICCVKSPVNTIISELPFYTVELVRLLGGNILITCCGVAPWWCLCIYGMLFIIYDEWRRTLVNKICIVFLSETPAAVIWGPWCFCEVLLNSQLLMGCDNVHWLKNCPWLVFYCNIMGNSFSPMKQAMCTLHIT